MRLTRKSAALAAAAALSVTLVACGNSPAGGGGGGGAQGGTATSLAKPAYNPQPYDNIKDGGSFTTDTVEINAQFNLFHGDMTRYTRDLWNWYNPMWITFSPTGDAEFNKDFLSDVKSETVSGNTKVTYTINPKATYNDGTPIDWTSFEATWKANNATNKDYVVNSSDGYDRVASVTKGVDDRQAVVTYNGLNVWWQGVFNNLLNPKALALDVFNKGYIDTPHPEWGAGPYTIQKYDKDNKTITFERNPKWWGNKGKLDTRTFIAMDPSASINAFKNGQLDSTEVNTSDRVSQVKTMPDVDIRTATYPATFLFTLNSKTPVLSDPQVRKAIFEGIDRTQINKVAFQGIDYTEPLAGSMTLYPFQKGYADNFSKVVTFDKEQSKKDLDAAGWKAGADGTRTKDGKPLTISYVMSGDNPVRKAMASATIAMLKEVGVTVEFKQVPSSDFAKVLKERAFDIFLSGFIATDPFGVAYFCQVWCSDSSLNKSGTNDPAFDAKVKEVTTLPTAEEQFAKANEVEIEAFKTYGLMPVQNGPWVFAVKKGLANYGSSLFTKALPETIGWQK